MTTATVGAPRASCFLAVVVVALEIVFALDAHKSPPAQLSTGEGGETPASFLAAIEAAKRFPKFDFIRALGGEDPQVDKKFRVHLTPCQREKS
jgi:hypothetical protein